MPTLNLTHFQSMTLFALVISVAFALLNKRTLKERLWYGLTTFLAFLGVAVAVGWLMYFLAR